MLPMLAGMFAMNAIGGIVSGNRNAAGQYAQTAQGYQQEAQGWVKNQADNKAIAEANLTNQIRTGYRVGLMNVQMGQAKKRIMQEGLDLSKMREQALGAATANAAAAGTIGPSVDAVIGDIEQRTQQASAALSADAEQTADNFGTQLTEMLWAGEDALRSPETHYAIRNAMPQGFKASEAIFGALIDTAGSYMSAKMTLGLGK